MTTYLRWDAPTTGPKPDGYEVHDDEIGIMTDTKDTTVAIEDNDNEATYRVHAYVDYEGWGRFRSPPIAYTRGFRITAIEIRDNGVILSFPTRIGSMYTVEKTTDLANGPWVEFHRFEAQQDPSKVGGELVPPRMYYRAWRLA